MPIELLCTLCGTCSASAGLREADALVRCESCSGQLEFRQMHEAACASHRAELLRRCPGLAGVLEPDWLQRSLRAIDGGLVDGGPSAGLAAKP